jgi:ketopantoate reductase
MKINVIGPGAIGSLIGGLLAHKNHNVQFQANPESEQKKDERYLRLILPDRWLKIEHVLMNPVNNADAVIFALKRTQYSSISAEQLKKSMSPGCENVIFLNCDEDDIKHLIHENLAHTVALTLMTSVSLQQQDVELATTDSCIVYEKQKFIKELLSPLKDFGIKSIGVDHIAPFSNSFFIYELLFLPVAMCNTTLGYFLSFKEGRELALRILHEAIKTFAKLEMPIGKLPVMDPSDLIAKIEKKPEKFELDRNKCDRSYNTVLQSLLLNKKNDVNRLNGRLVALAKTAGVDPVWNWKLLQKVPRVAKFGFYPNPKELLGGIE